jgi:Zn-dependent protease
VAFGETWLLDRMLIWIPLVLSLTIHEWAHAWSAYQLGDDTAEREGRLTLNPLEHMDPIGSFLLPLLGIPFGWAKPVPINPARFRGSMDAGLILTALAGPISNLALALVSVALGASFVAVGWLVPGHGSALWRLLEMLVLLNVILAAFNLLPIPPLDGGRVVDGLMPRRLRAAWDRFAAVGPVMLGAVIVLPLMVGMNVLDWPIEWAGALVDSAAAFAPDAADPALATRSR